MKLNFRIDWGYQYLYSRRHYHPYYHWDGHLECSDGVIEKVFQLDYPVMMERSAAMAREAIGSRFIWRIVLKSKSLI